MTSLSLTEALERQTGTSAVTLHHECVFVCAHIHTVIASLSYNPVSISASLDFSPSLASFVFTVGWIVAVKESAVFLKSFIYFGLHSLVQFPCSLRNVIIPNVYKRCFSLYGISLHCVLSQQETLQRTNMPISSSCNLTSILASAVTPLPRCLLCLLCVLVFSAFASINL